MDYDKNVKTLKRLSNLQLVLVIIVIICVIMHPSFITIASLITTLLGYFLVLYLYKNIKRGEQGEKKIFKTKS